MALATSNLSDPEMVPADGIEVVPDARPETISPEHKYHAIINEVARGAKISIDIVGFRRHYSQLSLSSRSQLWRARVEAA